MGAQSIDRHLGNTACLAASVIAVWWAAESIGIREMVLFDPALRWHPGDSSGGNKKTAGVSSSPVALKK
jgi:hypothetical protein